MPFAMISLSIGELVAAVSFMFGLGLRRRGRSAPGDSMAGPKAFGFSLLWPIKVLLVHHLLGLYCDPNQVGLHQKTRLGRLSNAVRDNLQWTEFTGYNPKRVHYLVFIISGSLAI